MCRASEASFIANAHKITEWPNAFGAQYVISTVHGQVGQFAEAEAGWHRLLDLSHLHSDDLRRADSLEALSRLRISQGRLQEALNLKHAALAVYERLNDDHAVMTLNNIAHTHLLLGQFGDAHLTASNALKRCPGDRLGFRATLLQTLGTAQLHRGQLDDAERLFADGMKLAAMPGQERSLVVSYMLGNGMLACARSSFKAGAAALKSALAHAQRWQLVTSQVDALEALTKAYQQAGDAKMAQHYAAQHAALVQKLGIERNKLQVRVASVAPVVADLHAQWLTKLRFA
jgi:tetratricopeptide (TPR) repeat protein